MADSAFFLFLDTETDGNGSFREPFSQTVVQVSWTLTDRTGHVLNQFTSFVKGAVHLQFNPNNWTLEQINSEGLTPLEARNRFIEAVNCVNRNDGYVVAHNIEFDMLAMQSLGVPLSLFKKPFCTKTHTTLICCIPTKYGFKWPRQVELYQFLFPDRATQQSHDAGEDVNMLMENFFECVRRAQNGEPKYFAFSRL